MAEVIRGVNFGSYVFASFIAGYVMMGADLMLEGFLGLFGTYRTYVELIGMWGLFRGFEDWIMAIGHTLNSLLLALFFVHPKVYTRLPFKSGLAKGLVFGILWHVFVLAFALITAFGGSNFMKGFLHVPPQEHVSLFLLHLIWAGALGLLYSPPEHTHS